MNHCIYGLLGIAIHLLFPEEGKEVVAGSREVGWAYILSIHHRICGANNPNCVTPKSILTIDGLFQDFLGRKFSEVVYHSLLLGQEALESPLDCKENKPINSKGNQA